MACRTTLRALDVTFFDGDQYLDADAGNAVKPDLIIPLVKSEGDETLGYRAS